MSIEGQRHFFTIYFPGFVCFVLYKAKILGERLRDHWSSGLIRFRTLGYSIFVILGHFYTAGPPSLNFRVLQQSYWISKKLGINNDKFRSFKSKENIHKKEVGPYCGFGY